MTLGKWDIRFMQVAELIATWSKDPSTKVGAVITDENNRIIATGFNGFPKPVRDCIEKYNDRKIKHSMVVHAEVNAIISAHRSLAGCSVYVTHHPCSKCSPVIIQSGIQKVVFNFNPEGEFEQRYKEDLELSSMLLEDAKIQIIKKS